MALIEVRRRGRPPKARPVDQVAPVDQADTDQVPGEASDLAERLLTVSEARQVAQTAHTAVIADLDTAQADRRTAELAGDVLRAVALSDKVAELTATRDRLAERVEHLCGTERMLAHEIQRIEWCRQLEFEEAGAVAAKAYAIACAKKLIEMRAEMIELTKTGRNAEDAHRMHLAEAARLRASIEPSEGGFVPEIVIEKPVTSWVRYVSGAIEFTETRF